MRFRVDARTMEVECIMFYRTTYLKITAIVGVGFVVTTCAPYQTLKGYDERPMMASMMPVATPAPRPAQNIEDDSAGAMLEKGFLYFHQDQPRDAADAFATAISTGNLNDAGRALAYWHIAESERRLHNEDRTAEALASFALVAQDVIDVREQHRYAVDEEGDFVEHFKLRQRVDEARGYLNAIWAQRAQSFGRTTENPVVMQTADEARYFIEFVSPCSGGPDRQVEREQLEDARSDGTRLERVNLFCDSAGSVDQLYMLVPKEQTN